MANPWGLANTPVGLVLSAVWGNLAFLFDLSALMEIPVLDVELLKLDERLKLAYATENSAAVDLPAMIDVPLMLAVGDCKKIGARFKMSMQVPPGMHVAAVVLPRSGWGSRGLVIANTLGLIDADYQGEVMLTLTNQGREPLLIQPGDRIMQMLFIPVLRPRFTEVEAFSVTTERGEGGFGSSGS